MVHMYNRAFTFFHNVKPLTGRLTRWTDYLLQYNFPVITYQDRQILKPNHSLDKFGKKITSPHISRPLTSEGEGELLVLPSLHGQTLTSTVNCYS